MIDPGNVGGFPYRWNFAGAAVFLRTLSAKAETVGLVRGAT